jgi:hypothetical protein
MVQAQQDCRLPHLFNAAMPFTRPGLTDAPGCRRNKAAIVELEITTTR